MIRDESFDHNAVSGAEVVAWLIKDGAAPSKIAANALAQAFCASGILKFWSSGILGFCDLGSWDSGVWDSGLVGFGDSGILRFWDSGILGSWDFEILGFWDFAILGFWDSGVLGFGNRIHSGQRTVFNKASMFSNLL